MDAFISYRRKDIYAATLIRDQLKERYDADIFLDVYDIHNGDFRRELERCIETAPNFILILSSSVWERRNDGKPDFVREEIRIAHRLKKHFILVELVDYAEPSVSEWDSEDPEIAWLRSYEYKKFDVTSPDMLEASIRMIVKRMKDEDGAQFTGKKKVRSTNYYHEHGITAEDKLWVSANCECCRVMEQRMFERIVATGIFGQRESVNLFCLDLYDPETYAERFDLLREAAGRRLGIFGFCHDYDIEQAEALFGKGHFAVCTEEADYKRNLDAIMANNGLEGFDFIDMTLVLKDLRCPEEALDLLTRYVGPAAGVLYIRDLDDDAVVAYPDNNGHIAKMMELLKKCPSAGCRTLGRRIFSYLNKLYPEKVYLSDEVVSTANHKSRFCVKLCDAYFSYLLPEYANLCKEHPESYQYGSSYEWLKDNYQQVKSLFRSPEFYFRSGFMAGYCIIRSEENE